MNIYEFDVLKSTGEVQSLKDFEGKVILVVNSATHCGFTSQYNELRDLHNKYSEQGLVILDFPCNQFGEQAQGTNSEIAQFCSINFDTPYELYAKIDVNGENQTDLFKYLKSQKGFKGFNNAKHPLNDRLKEMFGKKDPDYASNDDIKWNFTKFLIDKTGQVAERFEPVDDMDEMEKAIEACL